MFSPSVFVWAMTQSIPAMIWVTSAAPDPSPTFTLTMRASGATPMKLVLVR